MDAARARTEARDSRIDGLHAEAIAAVGHSANTLRTVRDRYRDAGAETVIVALRAPFDDEGLDRFAEEVLPAF